MPPSQQWKAPSSKSTANNERLAIALLFPRPKDSIGIPALVVQRFSLSAISATARQARSALALRRGRGRRGRCCRLGDRKSTRLNSSHDQISYAVFCLKKKK